MDAFLAIAAFVIVLAIVIPALGGYFRPRPSVPTTLKPTFSEQNILDSMPRGVERSFYIDLAGTSHCNDDGNSRTAAIEQCVPGALLDSKWEPDNPYDPNAIAIFFNGSQLGYLDKRLAGETVRDAKRNGWRQVHYLAHRNVYDGEVVGATIFVVRLEPEAH